MAAQKTRWRRFRLNRESGPRQKYRAQLRERLRVLFVRRDAAKTRREDAWKTPVDRPGAATICEVANPLELEMFATQQTSEEYVETEKSGLLYRRWKMKRPRVADNEFLDTDSGCRVLAEYVGCDANSEEKRRRIKAPSLSAEEAAARYAARLNSR